MTDKDMLAINDAAPCPFRAQADGDRVRISWGDDPLDYIIISKGQASHFHDQIGAIIAGRQRN